MSGTDISKKLYELRLSRNLSQNDLSRLSGVRQANVSRIEAGKASPTVITLEALTSGLGMNLTLRYDGKSPPDGNQFGVPGEHYRTATLVLDYRFRHHMSQFELAEKAGLCQSTISRIEDGSVSPMISTLLAIGQLEVVIN